jgi:endonuclease III
MIAISGWMNQRQLQVLITFARRIALFERMVCRSPRVRCGNCATELGEYCESCREKAAGHCTFSDRFLHIQMRAAGSC